MYAWERGQLTLAAESMGAGSPRSQAGRPRAQAGRLRSHWQRGRDARAPSPRPGGNAGGTRMPGSAGLLPSNVRLGARAACPRRGANAGGNLPQM